MLNREDIIREQFSKLAPYYFNSAYFGPLPLSAQTAGKVAIERAANPSQFGYEEWRPLPDQLRNQIGQLLGAPGDQISHHGGVSEVIAAVSLGYPFCEGDAVVLMEGDYPSNILPWMLNEKRRGYKLHRLTESVFADVDELRRRLPTSTKVLNISHVMFNTGRRFDILEIGKLCRELNILFVVDVTQSFGGWRLQPDEIAVCDVIAGATYKWLLGPYGHAFGYWSKRALELVENTHLSWQTTVTGQGAGSLLNYTIEPLSGARRFDRGQAPNFISMKMLAQSLELLQKVSVSKVQEHNQQMVRRFVEGIRSDNLNLITSKTNCGNIICLRSAHGPSAEIEDRLRKNKIDFTIREGHLRFSFHLFNSIDEVDFLLRTLNG